MEDIDIGTALHWQFTVDLLYDTSIGTIGNIKCCLHFTKYAGGKKPGK